MQNHNLNFDSERALKNWIRDNSHLVFGEEIRWIASPTLMGENGNPMPPDLIGRDANGKIVIVEVKLEFDLGDSPSNRYDLPRKSVGQVLHYAHAYMRGITDRHDLEFTDDMMRISSEYVMRLFIVSKDFSQTVENICSFLRAHGINIQHLNVKNCIQREGDKQ